MKLVRRALSTLIIAFIFAVIVLTIFLYTIIQLSAVYQGSIEGFRNIINYGSIYSSTNLVLNVKGSNITIENWSPRDVALDYIVVYDSGAGTFKALSASSICGSTVLKPGESTYCYVEKVYRAVALVTVDGVIVYPATTRVNEITKAFNTTRIIPITFDINSPEGLAKEFDVPPNLVAKPYTSNRNIQGMASADKLLLLPPSQEAEFFNVPISTGSSGLPFGVAVIGYDPSWVRENRSGLNTPPRFSILLAGPKLPGTVFKVGGGSISLAENGWRILINNFTGVIKILRGGNVIACSSTNPSDCSGINLPAIGFWYYGVDSSLNLIIYFNGFAGYVANFMRISSSQSPMRQTSYFPYLYIGDVDGNGVNDVIFITEDVYYGSDNKIDDLWPYETGGANDYSDYSTQPLTLKLLQIGKALGNSDGSIDGSRYSGVLLYINIIFHDNSYPDSNQLADIDVTDWVLRILLIGENNYTYIVREYRYQEICNYHKTYVTNFGKDNYFVKISQSIYIPIPPQGRYWIAIAFQDPYKGGSTTNDADMTVGIELIGIIPFTR
jgi:hypothetical protein